MYFKNALAHFWKREQEIMKYIIFEPTGCNLSTAYQFY